MGAVKHRSATSKEETLAKVAQLDRRGYTQMEIAPLVGVSQPMVSMYLKELRGRYKEDQMRSTAELVWEKLQQYKEIRREAWEAWDRSKADADKQVEEFRNERDELIDDRGNPTGEFNESEQRIKRIVTKEGRLPENAYLATIVKTLEAERVLLGLDEQKAVDVNVISWDALARGLAKPDPIEAKFKALETTEHNNGTPP